MPPVLTGDGVGSSLPANTSLAAVLQALVQRTPHPEPGLAIALGTGQAQAQVPALPPSPHMTQGTSHILATPLPLVGGNSPVLLL